MDAQTNHGMVHFLTLQQEEENSSQVQSAGIDSYPGPPGQLDLLGDVQLVQGSKKRRRQLIGEALTNARDKNRCAEPPSFSILPSASSLPAPWGRGVPACDGVYLPFQTLQIGTLLLPVDHFGRGGPFAAFRAFGVVASGPTLRCIGERSQEPRKIH
jgi:hypothetical protein